MIDRRHIISLLVGPNITNDMKLQKRSHTKRVGWKFSKYLMSLDNYLYFVWQYIQQKTRVYLRSVYLFL